MKNKKFKVFLAVYSVLELAVLAGFCFCIAEYYIAENERQEGTIYSSNSDTITIKKYNEDKEEEAAVTVKGEERERILEIIEDAPENEDYNDDNFNYDYKLNFGNGMAGYIDTKEKIFDSIGFYELTEEECNYIESLLKVWKG